MKPLLFFCLLIPSLSFAHGFEQHGFARVRAVSPPVNVAVRLDENKESVLKEIARADKDQVSVLVFPELYLSGYTAEDYLFHRDLLDQVKKSLVALVKKSSVYPDLVFIVGTPWELPDDRLLNAAVVISNGKIRGVIPKSHLPNYGEFYESRWFTGGEHIDLKYTDRDLGEITVNKNAIFTYGSMRFAVEICEDGWATIPPSSFHALAGANVIFNLSASNELVGKADFRRSLVRGLSSQQIGAYVYASAGPWESSRDLVFGGHSLVAENGVILSESERFQFQTTDVTADLDLEKIVADRQRNKTFGSQRFASPYERVTLADHPRQLNELHRSFSKTPFVPWHEREIKERAREIFDIQVTGLVRRILATNSKKILIGVSGGSDSTLAVLVAHTALKLMDRPATDLLAVTMPGMGTSSRTKNQANDLMMAVGAERREISIVGATEKHFADIGQDRNLHDVTYENAQARERTQILFDLANKEGGIVLGTGDLSELCLGWCTYNGDQMSNYSINGSVPKTLVKFLIQERARSEQDPKLKAVLSEILDTPISPELKPVAADGQIAQLSEETFGPYEVVDFVLFHLLRNHSSVRKIEMLAKRSFKGDYEDAKIELWIEEIYRRFQTQRFKSTAQPGGPKVGSVSISPRDSRYPDDLTNCQDALTRFGLRSNVDTESIPPPSE